MTSQANNCGLATYEDSFRVKVEFAVDIRTESDLNKIRKALKDKDIELVSSNINSKSIQLELSPKISGFEPGNVQTLQKFIEEQTGILTVVKGLGSLNSAVAELKPPNKAIDGGQQTMGIVRVSQVANNHCFFDGLIDGLVPGIYSLAVHEFGDLSSDTYESVGKPVVEIDNQTLGSNAMSIRRIVPDCNVAHVIGQSVALSSQSYDHKYNNNRILTAGVLARASTIEENKKQFCSCSGKTLWEERKERQQKQ